MDIDNYVRKTSSNKRDDIKSNKHFIAMNPQNTDSRAIKYDI